MTGDAPPESLLAASERMYDGYAVLKAPHHGTAGYFFPLEIAADHILISNGPYRGGGEIADGYAHLPAVCHCSGNAVCSYYKEYGSSCNRLALCGASSRGTILPVRCPSVVRAGAPTPCRIRVVSRGKKYFPACATLTGHEVPFFGAVKNSPKNLPHILHKIILSEHPENGCPRR
jgi:hypothetical protein